MKRDKPRRADIFKLIMIPPTICSLLVTALTAGTFLTSGVFAQEDPSHRQEANPSPSAAAETSSKPSPASTTPALSSSPAASPTTSSPPPLTDLLFKNIKARSIGPAVMG